MLASPYNTILAQKWTRGARVLRPSWLALHGQRGSPHADKRCRHACTGTDHETDRPRTDNVQHNAPAADCAAQLRQHDVLGILLMFAINYYYY